MKRIYIFGWLLVVLFLCLQHTQSMGQAHPKPQHQHMSVEKMKKVAEYSIKTGDTYTGLFYYEEIVEKDTQDIAAQYRIAELYRISRNYRKAEVFYKKVSDTASTKYPLAMYYMGIMQKMNGKYKEAKETLTTFRSESRGMGDKMFRLQVSRQLKGCDSAMNFIDFPDNMKVYNLGNQINHPHLEFSPWLKDSTHLIYGSLREDTLHFYDVSYEHREKTPTRQLYYAELEDSTWVEKRLFSELNETGKEMGNIVYSPYKKRYYFTKCYTDNHMRKVCELFYADVRKGKVQEAIKLDEPINIKGYSATQPAVYYDTARKLEYLYFVSDRPEGKGDLDIWYTFFSKKKKMWMGPYNLKVANTSQVECTPFYHQSTGTLYFSSNGQYTTGGLDIFKTKKNGRRWSRPKNLGFPTNSPQDDLSYFLDEKGKKGFVVSNRIGGTPYFHATCCDDIYGFEVLPPKPFNVTIDLAVRGEDDTTDCKGAELTVKRKDLKTQKEFVEVIVLEDCKKIFPLSKDQEYTFSIKKKGYQPDSLTFLTRKAAQEDTIQKELVLRPIKKKVKLPTEIPTEEKPFVLKDLHYASNAYELNAAAKTALDSLLIPFLKLHPNDNVQIASHTDDVGSKKYNENLSQKRADYVVKYLISKGIEPKRLEAKGYGESKPITPNLNPDGTGNEMGRSLNRRTEFFLIPAGS